MKKTILATSVLAFLFAPYLAFAACTLPNVWNPGSIQGPLVTCTGNIIGAGGAVNTNACTNLGDLVCTVTSDIYVGIAFVIWIILPISFVAGGIMYMLAGANPGLLGKAKSTLMGAVIGAIIVLCSYLLIATFVHFMNISNIGGFGAPITLPASSASSGGSNQGVPCGNSYCTPPEQCVAAVTVPGIGTVSPAHCGVPTP
jgi:hypothetical protein